MRLAGLALSAAILSGCSYLGGAPSQGGLLGGWFSGAGATAGQFDRCRIPYRGAPVPPGCHPSQISVGGQINVGGKAGARGPAHPGGFPQSPQWDQPQYATAGFGSHVAGNPHLARHQGGTAPRKRRPMFRGTLDIGAEVASTGNVLDNNLFPTTPFASYDPNAYQEGTVIGSVPDGAITTTRYYVDSRLQNTPEPYDSLSQPDISFSDAWSAPTTIGIGGEFLLTDKATLFGRVGYTRAEGTSGGAASIEATAFKETTTDTYDADANFTGRTVGTIYSPEQRITEISYDFSDLGRLDIEAGARFYTEPVAGRSTGRTVTPFVGASAGMSRLDAVSYTLDQRQLRYTSVFEEDAPGYYDLDVPQGFDLDDNPATPGVTRVDLYDSQWVLSGGLQAGVEWQVLPSTALAFETGIKVQGAPDYANGQEGAARIAVPLTIRGSFNF